MLILRCSLCSVLSVFKPFSLSLFCWYLVNSIDLSWCLMNSALWHLQSAADFIQRAFSLSYCASQGCDFHLITLRSFYVIVKVFWTFLFHFVLRKVRIAHRRILMMHLMHASKFLSLFSDQYLHHYNINTC